MEYNYLNKDKKQCVKKCENDDDIKYIEYKNYCLKNECGEGNWCVGDDSITIKCYVDGNCNDYPYLIESTNECVKFCKDPYFYLDGRYTYTTCVKSCKEHTKFFDPYSRKCLDKCPEDYFEKYNYKTRECMAECEENLKYRLDEESNACLDDCSPNDTLHYTDVSNQCKKKCEWIDLKTNKCINSCNTFYYVDDNNNKLCTGKCDENHYIDGTDGKKCIENCIDFITEDKKNVLIIVEQIYIIMKVMIKNIVLLIVIFLLNLLMKMEKNV